MSGPLLFTLYAFAIVGRHLPSVHTYADDTQLYLALNPEFASSVQNAIAAMEHCIHDIRAWMLRDNLKINDGKSEFMVTGTRQQLSKVHISSIKIGDACVSSVSSVKNSGSWFDNNMSMHAHINHTCKAAYYHLINVRRIRKYLSNEETQSLVHALMIGRMYVNKLR